MVGYQRRYNQGHGGPNIALSRGPLALTTDATLATSVFTYPTFAKMRIGGSPALPESAAFRGRQDIAWHLSHAGHHEKDKRLYVHLINHAATLKLSKILVSLSIGSSQHRDRLLP